MSKALVTMFHGTHEVFRPITAARMDEFAAVHGYTVVEARHTSEDLEPVWDKVPALATALARHDYVTWLDCDCWINDLTHDPADELQAPDFLAIPEDLRYGICAAVFTLRRCTNAHLFLLDVWAERYTPRPDWEQGAMQQIITKDPTGVQLLSYDWLGAEGYSPSARIWHGCRQTGTDVRKRADNLRSRVEEGAWL